MKKKRATTRRKNTLTPSWTPWFDLARQTSEMLTASAQVIGHRTRRLARAGVQPSERDRREFTRMGQEKIAAAAESARAMAREMLAIHLRWGRLGFEQALAGMSAAMSPIGSRSAAKALRRQTALADAALVRSGQLASSMVRGAQKGLRPVHSRATANARRLGTLRKRRPPS